MTGISRPAHGWPVQAPGGRVAYVNGRYVSHAEACVHVEDRGLQFSDAVYEVFGIVARAILNEEQHLDRLERSLRELQIAMPIGRAPLALVVREVARRNRVNDGLVYLQVTRGAFRRDHAVPAASSIRPTLILTARSMATEPMDARRESGVSVVTLPDRRWGRRDIKSTSLLANVLAKTEARNQGAYEAWLVDGDGRITEGSSTTAWIVDGQGRLLTRELSHAILPGVTRRVLIELAKQAQVTVIERPFSAEEAITAQEALLTAATAGVMPVIAINGQRIGDGRPGPVTRRLQEIYRDRAAGVAQDH
jgi:D-alanine transaminase